MTKTSFDDKYLRMLNQEIKTLASSIGHAMRTPLWTLQEFAKMLNDDFRSRLDPEGRENMDGILAGIERLKAIAAALAEYSAVCHSEPQKEPVDMSAMAIAIGNALQQADPNRRVRLEVESGLTVSAMPAAVYIALHHLIANAWKFTRHTDDAGIVFAKATEDNGCVYTVKDNGAGFDPALAYKLFTPFQRLHSEPEFAGAGMGLAIVRRVIHLHGGRVWADGRPGQGATFSFTLPAL